MHYNFKADIERINSKFVANVEVSGPGRAGTIRVVADTIEEVLAGIKEKHDELLGGVEAYHAASVTPAGAEVPEAAAVVVKPAKTKAAPKKKAAKAKRGKKAPAKPKAPAPVKPKKRQFAKPE